MRKMEKYIKPINHTHNNKSHMTRNFIQNPKQRFTDLKTRKKKT